MSTLDDTAALKALALKLDNDALADAHALADALASNTSLTARNAALQAQIDALTSTIKPPILELPRLVWHDEFDGTSVDLSKWNVRNGWVGGNESSICWARNVSVANGMLTIQPKREASSAGGVTRQYTSGYLDTAGKLAIPKPSYIEYRARLPLKRYYSRGMWPAFWFRLMQGSLEIDVMEAWGTPSDKADTFGRFQFAIWPDTMANINGYHGWYTPTAQDLTQWHTYGARFDADGTISFYYDGAPVGFETWANGVKTVRMNITPAQMPGLSWNPILDNLHIRLNLQVGQPTYYGDPDANTDFSQHYDVDYVRCWTS